MHVHSFFAYQPRERRKTFRVRSLAVDEALVVTKSEYHGRGDFSSDICSLANKHGRKYTTRTLKDKSGWAVLRLK